jgi:transcription initiation factor IIE alpha subunit
MKRIEENNEVSHRFSPVENTTTKTARNDASQSGLFCPNCGAALEAQKCKLFCRTVGCGYLVTCSEW